MRWPGRHLDYRTWVTGETVTAALLNTHLRDNLLQTAPALVTTAGDITYATAASTLARLGVGASNQVLAGGASAPAWASEIGDATNGGALSVAGTQPRIGIRDTDQADPLDRWDIIGANGVVRLAFWDETVADWDDSLWLNKADFVLHTGDKGTGQGAVIIGTDTAGSVAFSATGANYLTAAITTGGPAYVEGFYMLTVKRTGAGTAEELSILPRDDGTNLSSVFWLSDATQTFIPEGLPDLNDEGTYTGSFWVRHTATNTSTYQIFISSDLNNRFEAVRGQLYVRSIQYPT